MSNCSVNFTCYPICDYIYLTMEMVSLAMCVTAIAIIIHFKFYRSFNYRLILYQLISLLLFEIGLITDELLFFIDPSFCQKIFQIQPSFYKFVAAYCLCNILLCIAFMIAEIFSMVVLSVELRRAEIPTIITCFILPLIPALVAVQTEDETYFEVTYVLGMIFVGVCIVPIAIALTVLACRSLRGHSNNDSEEQHILHQHSRQSYRTALKEILPFLVYPITALLCLLINFVLFIIDYVSIYSLLCRYITNGNMGTISVMAFFIHIKILGRRKRNAFRSRDHIIPLINTAAEIYEDQRLTVAGSITATHVTHFDPVGEDDIEA